MSVLQVCECVSVHMDMYIILYTVLWPTLLEHLCSIHPCPGCGKNPYHGGGRGTRPPDVKHYEVPVKWRTQNVPIVCIHGINVQFHLSAGNNVRVLLYYFDRSFMVCYTLPNLFTGHIVHDHLLPVTTRKIVHSQVQK